MQFFLVCPLVAPICCMAEGQRVHFVVTLARERFPLRQEPVRRTSGHEPPSGVRAGDRRVHGDACAGHVQSVLVGWTCRGSSRKLMRRRPGPGAKPGERVEMFTGHHEDARSAMPMAQRPLKPLQPSDSRLGNPFTYALTGFRGTWPSRRWTNMQRCPGSGLPQAKTAILAKNEAPPWRQSREGQAIRSLQPVQRVARRRVRMPAKPTSAAAPGAGTAKLSV